MRKRLMVLARSMAALGMMMTLAMSSNVRAASIGSREVSQFKLANGMQVVVVPDRRAPVVTHMVWYRVGAADEPRGESGIAHFLEHLMFKSTDQMESGEFSKTVSRLGGQDNAFTSQDATAYFQRINRDNLPTVMRMEADRMVNLHLNETEVRTERDVILEERRSRIENKPSALLEEQMDAALFVSHPYGVPVIGWMHEMEELSQADALGFYKKYYAPNNAILIVAGDVDAEEVRKLANETYGKIPANPDVAATRTRIKEPPARAARRVVLRDERAGTPQFRRSYLGVSYATAEPGEAEALDLLMKVLASGATSRLYQKLVVDEKLATSAGGYYSGSGLDYGKLVISAVPADGVKLEDLEAAVDRGIAEVVAKGISPEELERARKSYIADFIYDIDSQSKLARRYGWGMVVGETVEEIDGWPDALKKVTAEDVQKVAARYLDLNASVTGYLIPEAPTASGGTDNPTAPSMPSRS